MKNKSSNSLHTAAIIQVLGPTGVGKSGIAVQLAVKFAGEIISADSMQVYKGFDIGTAKIPARERRGIPHHLLDIIDDCSQFNASRFLQKAYETAGQITANGHLPIVCGGTALYLRTMINGIFPESGEIKVSRSELKAVVEREGSLNLWQKLNEVDPQYAAKISQNDAVRIIRALEIYYNNGIPPSEIFKQTVSPFKDYRFIRIGLNTDREKLYRAIEQRVEQMIERGLVEEVRRLRRDYPIECPPFKSLGYKEIGQVLDGEIDLETAVQLIKQHTRNFAKRQLSWFRQEKDIHWFTPGQVEDIEAFVHLSLS